MRGIPAVPGVAYGPAFRLPGTPSPARLAAVYADPDEALAAYDAAVTEVADGYTRVAAAATGAVAQILRAAAVLTRDPALREAVAGGLRAGRSLPDSLDAATRGFADRFALAGGAVAARAADLHDIERRILAALSGGPLWGPVLPARPSVLLAESLAPADVVTFDRTRVLAIVTARGTPAGHVAVIARERAIPCVVGVAAAPTVPDGTAVLVDGSTGEVEVDPDPETTTIRVEAAARARDLATRWTGPGSTRDGVSVRLLVNLSDPAAAPAVAHGPAEGVGLFRTELCFLGRDAEPGVAEQAGLYARVLEAFGPGRQVVFRTLDAGSDKPFRIGPVAHEPNPALGVRGVRRSLRDPQVLDRQLDAIAAAGARTATSPRVMAPMVATVAEAAGFAARAHARGLTAGVMVEVPGAALRADRLLEHVDFLSVGTNDLAQYTMAADRNAPDLAALVDPWQPAVLALVAHAAGAGRAAGRPVSVCGEAAADPLLAAVLVGLGVTSLSMAPSALGAVGVQLAGVTREACGRAAEAALAQDDPLRARTVVREILSATTPPG